MLKLAAAAALLYTIHFFMLGAVTGAAMNLVGALRCYTFYKVKPTEHHQWVLWFFIAVAVSAAAVTWQGPVSLLAMFGTIFSGIASWHKKPKFIRRFALSAPPMWFSYNAISGSYPGMFIEVTMFISNLVGQYRFDYRHKSHTRRRLAHPA